MKSRVSSPEMLMILCSGLTFSLVSRGWAGLCLVLCFLALASWLIPWRYTSSPRGQKTLGALAGLSFFVLAVTYAKNLSHPVEMAMRVAVLGAVFALIRMVLELYRRPDHVHSKTTPIGTLGLMVVGGLSLENPYYNVCLAVYSGAAIMFMRSRSHRAADGSKSPRWLVALSFLLALLLANALTPFMPHLRRLAWQTEASVLSGEGPAKDRLFGAGSSLWSIENLSNSRELVARVFGPSTKLRGRVRTFYRDGRWLPGTPSYVRWEDVSGAESLRLHGAEPAASQRWRVCPVRPLDGPLPLPPGVFRLKAGAKAYRLGAFDQIECRVQDCYTAWAPASLGDGRSPARPVQGGWRWLGYLDTPPPLREALDSVGNQILRDLKEPEDMAQALEDFLSENGSFGAYDWEQAGEPLKNFLTVHMRGTSEFYATAMALILRRQGIPTRYVVGYQVVEENTWGGYFMVRDRDARAWVEVALDGRGWVAFDPTPRTAHLVTHPEGYRSSNMEAFVDNLKVQGQRFWDWLLHRDWARTAGLFLALLLLSGLSYWLLKRRPQAPLTPTEVHRAELERLFQRASKGLAARGVVRENWETPLELAQRASPFSQMSQWLRDYCRVRFGRAGEEQIRDLEISLQQAVESLQK